MDDFARHEVLLAFTHRGRRVQLHASAKGWAALYLKAVADAAAFANADANATA